MSDPVLIAMTKGLVAGTVNVALAFLRGRPCRLSRCLGQQQSSDSGGRELAGEVVIDAPRQACPRNKERP
jgi:hypothetical protein